MALPRGLHPVRLAHNISRGRRPDQKVWTGQWAESFASRCISFIIHKVLVRPPQYLSSSCHSGPGYLKRLAHRPDFEALVFMLSLKSWHCQEAETPSWSSQHTAGLSPAGPAQPSLDFFSSLRFNFDNNFSCSLLAIAKHFSKLQIKGTWNKKKWIRIYQVRDALVLWWKADFVLKYV